MDILVAGRIISIDEANKGVSVYCKQVADFHVQTTASHASKFPAESLRTLLYVTNSGLYRLLEIQLGLYDGERGLPLVSDKALKRFDLEAVKVRSNPQLLVERLEQIRNNDPNVSIFMDMIAKAYDDKDITLMLNDGQSGLYRLLQIQGEIDRLKLDTLSDSRHLLAGKNHLLYN